MIPDEEVRLTKLAHTAGCAAKIGPGTLAGILEPSQIRGSQTFGRN